MTQIVGYTVLMANIPPVVENSQDLRELGLKLEAEKRGLTLYGDVYEHRAYGNLVPSGETLDDGEPIAVWEDCGPNCENATYVRITLESRAKEGETE